MQPNSNKDNRKGKLIYIATLGCQMNDVDSEVMERLLEREGNWKIDSPEGAVVVILKNNN